MIACSEDTAAVSAQGHTISHVHVKVHCTVIADNNVGSELSVCP